MKRLAVHRLPCGEFKRPIYFCRLKTLPMGRATQEFWEFLVRRTGAAAETRAKPARR